MHLKNCVDKMTFLDLNIKLIQPHTLSLIVTYQCTSACPNCCFNCSPVKSKKMTYEEIIYYIDLSVREFPSLKTVVFTGGECTLIGIQRLARCIKYATDKGLRTRIVTNGHWGTTLLKATNILKKLALSGLKEVNLSTGDEHASFVPIDRIFNVVVASQEIKEITSVIVSIEDNSSHHLSINTIKRKFNEFTERENLSDIDKRVVFISSPWCVFNKVKVYYEENAFEKVDTPTKTKRQFTGCDNIFTGININCDGQLLCCCGLAAEYSPFLKSGDIKHHNSIKTLYNRLFDDFLKIWLYTSGPENIISYLEKKQLKENNEHPCIHCLRLLFNVSYIEKMTKLDKSLIHREIFKFNLKAAPII